MTSELTSPEPKPEVFSRWNNDDIAALLPGAQEVVHDPSKIDFAALNEHVDEILARLTRTNIMLKSRQFRKVSEDKDIGALRKIFNQMDRHNEDAVRLSAFSALLPNYVEDQPANVHEQAGQLVGKIDSKLALYDLHYEEIMNELGFSIDNDLAQRIQKDADLKEYGIMLQPYRQNPTEVNSSATDTQLMESGSIKIQRATSKNNLLQGEKEALFAEGLQEVARFRLQQARAQGYASTAAQYAASNGLTEEAITQLLNRIEQGAGNISYKWAEFSKEFVSRNLQHQEFSRYSWQEAKDIIVNAWASFDPEMGKVAQHAFDEGWIYARRPTQATPLNQNFAVHAPRDSHPFIFAKFSGGAQDIAILGHEVGHLIAMQLSTQKQRTLRANATPSVHENYAFLGEELVAKEMLRCAGDDVGKRLQAVLTRSYRDVTNLGYMAERIAFEKALYDRISKNDSPATYDELNACFKELCPRHGCELIELPTIHFVSQSPHNMLAYPLARIMAPAISGVVERDPAKANVYRALMERGSNLIPPRIWNDMVGKETLEDPQFLAKQFQAIEDRMQSAIDTVREMPVVEVPASKAGQDRELSVPLYKGSSAPVDDVVSFSRSGYYGLLPEDRLALGRSKLRRLKSSKPDAGTAAQNII